MRSGGINSGSRCLVVVRNGPPPSCSRFLLSSSPAVAPKRILGCIRLWLLELELSQLLSRYCSCLSSSGPNASLNAPPDARSTVTALLPTMRASTTTTLVESTANRRQPVRQTRINPSRAANASRANGPADDRTKDAPGFFPGITHFTDTITALPKEMIRHYTMLKEVDVKIFAPEENLKKLLATVPPRPPFDDEAADLARRQHFLHARIAMSEMLPSLDEKNHAVTMANDNLAALLARLDSAWPQIEREISEEARWGSLNHWAYTDKTAEKKNTVATERTRREVALANSLAAAAAGGADADAGPSRADTRGKSRKAQAQQHADSEHEDPRHGKKAVTNNKRSKPSDFATANGTAASAAANGSKRRKVEKPTPNHVAGGAPMEKSLSAVFGSNARGGASPRETPTAESSRKKGRAGQASTNASGRRRYAKLKTNDHSIANVYCDRAGTVNSSVNSPNPASSPIVGTFSSAAKRANSPALGAAMQRTSSARLRQSSTQAPATNKPLPAAADQHNITVGLGLLPADERPLTANSASDAKTAKAEGNTTAETDVRTSGRSTAMKREDSNSSRTHRPPSISTATRNNGKASKTGTPVAPSFAADAAEPGAGGGLSTGSGSNGNGNGSAAHPPRSARATVAVSSATSHSQPSGSGTSSHSAAPTKRSHKKGAGLQAQLAAAQAAVTTKKGGARDEDPSSGQEEDEDAEGELTYCYCNGPSYGQMVACDMAGCEREWFHLQCVGLTRPPNSKSESIPSSVPGLKRGRCEKRGILTIR